MAVDMFLKLDDIDGESADSKHKGEIEILSYSFGAANAGSASGGGGGSGKVSFQDLHFTQSTNKATPTLLQKCATGQHIKDAVLTVRKSGGGQLEYLKVELEDILVTSFQEGATADAADTRPTEQVSLNFGKITFSYTPQDSRGVPQPPEIIVVNVAENQLE